MFQSVRLGGDTGPRTGNPCPIWRVYLGCCQTGPGVLRWKLRNGVAIQRHLKDETHSWKSSVGLKPAKYCTPFLCVCFCCLSCCYYTTPACRLFTSVLLLCLCFGPLYIHCYVVEKDPDDLEMCIGRCGCKWTKDIILERKYGSKNHMSSCDAFHWRKDVLGGGRGVWRGVLFVTPRYCSALFIQTLQKSYCLTQPFGYEKRANFLWPFYIVSVIWKPWNSNLVCQ